MPRNTPQNELQTLLQQRFEVAKKLHFPNWKESWWEIHVPDMNDKSQVVEWYTHMPKEFLVA
jgi:hypothetical protein